LPRVKFPSHPGAPNCRDWRSMHRCPMRVRPRLRSPLLPLDAAPRWRGLRTMVMVPWLRPVFLVHYLHFHQALGHLCLRTIADHPTPPVMTRPRSACCHSSNWLRRNSYTSSITPSSSASRSSMYRSQSTCLRQATRRQRGRRSAEMFTAQRKRKGARQLPWAFPTLGYLSSS